MSHSQFHCTGRVYLDLHGLIFETSICYWQDQPGSLSSRAPRGAPDVRPPETPTAYPPDEPPHPRHSSPSGDGGLRSRGGGPR